MYTCHFTSGSTSPFGVLSMAIPPHYQCGTAQFKYWMTDTGQKHNWPQPQTLQAWTHNFYTKPISSNYMVSFLRQWYLHKGKWIWKYMDNAKLRQLGQNTQIQFTNFTILWLRFKTGPPAGCVRDSPSHKHTRTPSSAALRHAALLWCDTESGPSHTSETHA